MSVPGWLVERRTDREAGLTKPKTKNKKKRKQQKRSPIKKHKKLMTVKEVSIEFHRWKRTEEFTKWKKKQFLKQGGLCWYCADFLPVTRINIEHKTARSRGGRNNKGNLVLSCSHCNKDKGSKALSPARRGELNRQNANGKGTYLKNKDHFSRQYTEFSDEAMYAKLKQL